MRLCHASAVLTLMVAIVPVLAMAAGAPETPSCPGLPKCPGNPCEMLGLTTMSDDQKNIIACLLPDSGTGGYIYKTTISEISCDSGQALARIENGKGVCADLSAIINVSSCASGTFLVGISDGKPVCATP